jgi:aspartate carbamoyltransferase catalytic subunit
LLGIQPLARHDLELIFRTADEFQTVLDRPIKKVPAMREVTIGNLFFESSTRTRMAFELAEKRLSADVTNFSAAASSLKKGETLLDTVRNILALKVDMIVVRHPHPGAAAFLANKVDATVINAGDGTHEHPTQAILDTYTLRQRLGELTGVRVVITGDIKHSRVALSNIFALQRLGAEVAVCGPPTLLPRYIDSLGVHVFTDLDQALLWGEVMMMLRIQTERMEAAYFPDLREYARLYGLNAKRLRRIDKELLVMHPGPVNRGVELTDEVADHPTTSLILDQVTNGLATRMAVLYLLSGGSQPNLAQASASSA